ncbi:MAG: TetR/AcrR family transcriptional regulator [Acidimicrobiia bacterium]|nr:TetR/AcrR family transcriptional regulator [Acidimicrobiia bacterium]
MGTDQDDAVALDGRTLGRRGLETRRRLLDATEELLRENGLRDLRVVDIARRVGSSPATFYQYFKDADEAVLVLAWEVAEAVGPVVEIIDGSWEADEGLDRARRLTTAYVELWDAHHAVMRVRNLAADEGDRRFREARLASVQQLTEHLCDKIAAFREAGRVSSRIDPYAAAASLVAMLERVGAYHWDVERFGPSPEAMIDTPALIVYQTVTGSQAA